MWRSLFYAVGISLFALGLQTLIVEHVTVPKNTKFQKLVRKILADDKPVAINAQPVFQQTNPNQAASNFAQQVQQPSQNPFSGQYNGVDTGSRFGPSRFSGPAYGTGYGGPRVNSASTFAQNSPQFLDQNRTNAQLAGFSTPAPVSPANNPQLELQKIVVREWMPWSLLASGAIIFLYTHTHQRRRHSD